jgi:gas vesicle protein
MYHDMESNQTGGGMLTGLVIGIAVGTALGLAFAPYAGVETRRRLAESSQKLKDRAVRGYEQARGNVNQFVDRGREAVARGQEAYQRARSDAAQTMEAS